MKGPHISEYARVFGEDELFAVGTIHINYGI